MTTQSERLFTAALLILFLLCLSACSDSSSSSSPSSSGSIKLIDEAPPATPNPNWSAPATASAAELEFRGSYAEQNKPANTLSMLNNFTTSGSRATYYTFVLNGNVLQQPTTCTWSGMNVRAEARADGRWNFWMTLTAANYNANSTTVDCMKTPTNPAITEVALFVRFIDASCVGLQFDLSTGEKIYCK